MGSLVGYLDCGNIYKKCSVSVVYYEVKKVSDLNDKILPFFIKYPLLGSKKENFEDFCKIVSRVKDGSHLTESV